MSVDSNSSADALAAYIMDEVGVVPDGIRAMAGLGEEWVSSFLTLRKAISDEREGGLDQGMQALVFMVIAVTLNHLEGAIAHARRAIDCGVHPNSVRQALTQVTLFAGTNTWARTGSKVVRELNLIDD